MLAAWVVLRSGEQAGSERPRRHRTREQDRGGGWLERQTQEAALGLLSPQPGRGFAQRRSSLGEGGPPGLQGSTRLGCRRAGQTLWQIPKQGGVGAEGCGEATNWGAREPGSQEEVSQLGTRQELKPSCTFSKQL